VASEADFQENKKTDFSMKGKNVIEPLFHFHYYTFNQQEHRMIAILIEEHNLSAAQFLFFILPSCKI